MTMQGSYSVICQCNWLKEERKREAEMWRHYLLRIGIVFFQAQGNLNNCLLSNTTILAEFASDAEVKQVMGQPSHQGQTAPPTPAPNNNSAWGGSGRGSTPTSQPSSGSKVDSWGNGNGAAGLWSTGPAVGTSLWGGGALADADQHRSTPSSLKPYLPDGLLTSESI